MANIFPEQCAEPSDCRMSGATVTLLSLSRAFCVAPVSFEQHRFMYTVRVSRKSTFIVRSIFVLYGITVYASLAYGIYYEKNQWDGTIPKNILVVLMINYVNSLLATVKFMVGAYGAAGRMRRFLSYYRRIQQIHVSIEDKTKSKAMEKLFSTVLVGYMPSVIITCIAKIVESAEQAWSSQWSFAIYIMFTTTYMSQIISTLLVLQVIFLVISAFWSMKSLNKCLKNLDDRIREGSNGEDNLAVIDTIDRFSKIYSSILDVCTQINLTEGFTMLLLLSDYTLKVLTTFFYVKYANLCTECGGWVVGRLVVQTGFCLVLVSHIVLLIEPCHRTHVELNTTQALISRLLCCPSSAMDGVSKALVRFYEVTEHNCYVYSPMGTVKFSRSLYSGLIGGLITIAVIVLQI